MAGPPEVQVIQPQSCAPGTRTPNSSSRDWRVANYTRAQREDRRILVGAWPRLRPEARISGLCDGREIAVGVRDRIPGAGDVYAGREQAAGFGEVLGALDAEGAGDAAALQIPDGELAAVAIAAPD